MILSSCAVSWLTMLSCVLGLMSLPILIHIFGLVLEKVDRLQFPMIELGLMGLSLAPAAIAILFVFISFKGELRVNTTNLVSVHQCGAPENRIIACR